MSIVRRGWHDEPEEHVDHVDDPDGTVQVETITEHEFPVRDRLDLERHEGAPEGERERRGVKQGGR